MENNRIFKTPEGFELLTEWTYNNYGERLKTAKQAARRLKKQLEFLHGDYRSNDVDDVFGLPYTSSSSFAAVWNTNTEARLRGTRLYFNGIAVTTDGKAVGVFTELDADGNEIGEKYLII